MLAEHAAVNQAGQAVEARHMGDLLLEPLRFGRVGPHTTIADKFAALVLHRLRGQKPPPRLASEMEGDHKVVERDAGRHLPAQFIVRRHVASRTGGQQLDQLRAAQLFTRLSELFGKALRDVLEA